MVFDIANIIVKKNNITIVSIVVSINASLIVYNLPDKLSLKFTKNSIINKTVIKINICISLLFQKWIVLFCQSRPQVVFTTNQTKHTKLTIDLEVFHLEIQDFVLMRLMLMLYEMSLSSTRQVMTNFNCTIQTCSQLEFYILFGYSCHRATRKFWQPWSYFY